MQAGPLVQRLFSQRQPLSPDPYGQPPQTCAAGAEGAAGGCRVALRRCIRCWRNRRKMHGQVLMNGKAFWLQVCT